MDTKHPIIMENLHGIKRVRGTNQKSKKPILINDLKAIINKIDEIDQPEKKNLEIKPLYLLDFQEALEDQS